MQVKTQKSALNETLKAEENKVMAKQPAASSKLAKNKPQKTKPTNSATLVKKAVTLVKKSQPKKVAAPKKAEKLPKQKLVRDSFSMPENEYNLIAVLKKQCLAVKITVKKSELLRAGLKALSGMNQANLNKHLSQLTETKIAETKKAVKAK
jgi:hypothetical protein